MTANITREVVQKGSTCVYLLYVLPSTSGVSGREVSEAIRCSILSSNLPHRTHTHAHTLKQREKRDASIRISKHIVHRTPRSGQNSIPVIPNHHHCVCVCMCVYMWTRAFCPLVPLPDIIVRIHKRDPELRSVPLVLLLPNFILLS